MITPVQFRVNKRLVRGSLQEQDGRIYISSAYNPDLIKEIKCFDGAKWHGYEDPPKKVWSVTNNARNKFQLDYLTGKNPYARYDITAPKLVFERPLRKHQVEAVEEAMVRHGYVLAAEMGCISGDTKVQIKYNRALTLTLRELYDMYWGESEDNKSKFYIKSFNGKDFFWNKIDNVIYKGKKKLYRLTFTSGETLKLTSDHQVLIRDNNELRYIETQYIRVGDEVITINNAYNSVDEKLKLDQPKHTYDIVCADPYRNFLANDIVVHNCGKSLCAIEIMERSGLKDWQYVAPKGSCAAFELELAKWNSKIKPKIYTYEGMVKLLKEWNEYSHVPQGVVLDESQRIKNPAAQRSSAARHLADTIRKTYGEQVYVIEMSGSPAPKSPADWWNQCEVACPGFLKEGTYEKFKRRLGKIVQKESTVTGGVYPELVTWWDDVNKCAVCGYHRDMHPIVDPTIVMHEYQPSVNEVAALYKRMQGLVKVQLKKDCLDLPDKIYRVIKCEPNPSMLRALEMIKRRCSKVATALILARELSDGFQYEDVPSNMVTCDRCNGRCVINSPVDSGYDEAGEWVGNVTFEDIVCPRCDGTGQMDATRREAKYVHSPKEDALIELLEDHEDIERFITYAGFTASVDKCCEITKKHGWEYIRVDGRGWTSSFPTKYKPSDLLKVFQEGNLYKNKRVVYIAHPASGGIGVTLTASPTALYYSNDFNAENRIQSEDRGHRMGMDVNRGFTIIDIVHLYTDQYILDNLLKKRNLQDLSMGVFQEEIRKYEYA